jgi:DNA polymerase-3 subunit gamma/tau
VTALYTRYRSQRFDALVGQDAAVRTLRNALTGDRLAHAYLFTGIRGTGKTSSARILAKAVNCLAAVEGEPDNTCVNCVAINEGAATDLIEIDAASNRGVDEIRDLREKARYLPALLRRKVYIIDEAHQLTNEAFNALLKTLEEPPEHVLFILCTTESHKLPATIISRCQRFDFRRISEEDIAARLAWISEQEGLATQADGIELLAAMAQGSMRDAITMLDQMASSGVELIDAATVRRQLGLVTQEEIARMLAAAARGDAATVLRDLDRIAEQGADMRQLTSSLAEMGRRAALLSIGAGEPAGLGIEAAAEAAMAEVVGLGGREFAARAFELAVAAGADMRQTHDPRLLLELTLLKLATIAPPAHPAALPPPPVVPAGIAEARVAAPPAPPRPEVPAPPPAPPELPGPASEVPETTADAAGGPVTAAAGDLGEVTARWPALLDALRGSAPATRLRALLNDASPVAVEDDLLTLGFRFAIHSEKAQEPLHRVELEKAMGQVYGRTYRLAFRVEPGLQAVAGGGQVAGAAGAAGARYAAPADLDGAPSTAGARTNGAQSAPPPAGLTPAVEGDARGGEKLVEAAVEIFGARITDIRPRSRP